MRGLNRIAYLQLAAAIVLFGLSFPILKIGLRASTPVWLAAGRASLSALTAFVLLAALGRLRWPQRADWPIVLSVGAFQLTLYFTFANIGLQSVPPGRSGVLSYTAMLWMVPLSLLIGERVGWRALAGVALGLGGIVVLIDPTRFDWADRAVVEGHGWLLLAGFSLGDRDPACATPSLARLAARRAALADVGGDRDAVDAGLPPRACRLLSTSARPISGSRSSISAPSPGRPAPGPPSPSARALPPITGSLGMLGTPLVGIAASAVLVGEPITLSLLLGTALIIAGIAIVILDRTK